ncbi:hypothetical protein ACIP5Y_47810 [Nocardia sp. NPDC088792]|uniref:hypothetical protein n=1 Tax=Nocardia sp. NPDC088792 TaxID=3364332 RepID=UPI00380F4B23
MALVACGCDRLEIGHNRPDEAARIAKAATISGFGRTGIADVLDNDNPPGADAYFIGPAPKPDPLAVVSVPTIQLEATDPPTAEYTRQHPDIDLPVAAGKRPDGCMASVTFISNPPSSVVSEGWGNHRISILTDEQLAAVRNHTALVIELLISNCGW